MVGEYVTKSKGDNGMKYEDHKGTIIGLAIRYQTREITMEDLIAEGNLVYCQSLTAYDPSKRIKFNTFLFTNLRNRFINMHRDKKSKVKGRLRTASNIIEIVPSKKEPRAITGIINEMQQEMSDGANEIVNFICNTGDSILEALNVGTVSNQGLRITKKGLRKYFMTVKNWRHRDWVKSSKEITNYLARGT